MRHANSEVGHRPRREARRALSIIAATAVVAAIAVISPAGPLAERAWALECTDGAVNPMGGATPIGSDSGYTIYATGDGVLGNGELEGTLAIGGTATFGGAGGASGNYAIFHGGVGGSAAYDVPVIDGDQNRVLISEFGLPASDAPQRVAQVQVRVDGTPPAGAKIVDLSTPGDYALLPAYDSTGTTFALSPAAGGTNMSPQLSSEPQTWDGTGDSFVAAQQFSDYFPADTGASVLAEADYVTPSIVVGGEAAVTIDPSGPNLLALTSFGAAAKFTMTGFTAQAPLVIRIDEADVVDGVLSLPSYAVPGKDGDGTDHVLFDLSAIDGDVLVISRGGEPVRGSIYAPDAHVIFPPEAQGGVEFEGQVIAAEFTALQGGREIHTNLFAGLLPCVSDAVGGFSLQKQLAGGVDSGDLPAGASFTVTASWAIGGVDYEQTYEVPADGTVMTGPQDLPEGTVVTFSEAVPPDIPGWAFEDVEFSSPSVTIAEGENTVVTATNTYSGVGGFSVAKSIEGVSPADIPADLTVRILAVWLDDGIPALRSYDVPADGSVVVGAQDIPVGTVVTFLEPAPPGIDGYVFAGVTFSATQVTIGQGENVVVTATNEYEPTVVGQGGFSLRKALEGIDVDDLPADAEFEVTASWEGPAGPVAQTFSLPADGTEVHGPQDLASGTVVTFGEVTPPDVPGFAFDGVAMDPESLTIADRTDAVVTATNSYTADAPSGGGYTLQKEISGVAVEDLPPDLVFTVAAVRFVDGLPRVELFDLPADGTAVEGPQDLPVGTTVGFVEIGSPLIDGYEYLGGTIDPRVIQIGDGANPTVTVTNTYQGVGGFSLRKAIDGVDASDIPSGAEFDVVGWTRIDGEFAWRGFRLPADGSPVDGPDDLPTGTVVRFLEIDPPPIEGYTFESVSFEPDALVVGTGDSPVITATNTYAAMVGGFTVQKEVDGDATGDVPADVSFTVAYFVDGATEPSGLLGLPVDGTPIVGPSDLPVGTVVTFEEIGPLPEVPGASWGAPSITPAEVVIGDAENAVVTVTNVITADVGGFRIRKEVSGSAASLVPSETIFAVEYYLDGAAEPSGLLELPASGGFVDGPQDLRVGTVVTFAEITPMPIVPGAEWSDPGVFSPEAVVISAEEQSSVVLTNVAEAADDLPATGGSPPWQALLLALLLVAAGSAMASRRRAYR